PRGEVEPVVLDIRAAELLVLAGVRRLVLAGGDVEVEHRVREAAEAGAVEPRVERELEHAAGRRPRDPQRGGDLFRHGEVALAAQRQRLQLDLDLVDVLLARPELGVPEVEVGHTARVAMDVLPSIAVPAGKARTKRWRLRTRRAGVI